MKHSLNKNVRALGMVSLLNDASSDMLYPLIPLFLTKTLGASVPFVGLIEGVAQATASIVKLFSGWLSDKLGRRKSLTVIGYALSMISKPLLALATSPWHVLLVRFSDRFGKGIRQAPRDALIAESTPKDILGYAFGFHKMMDTVGATIGPILALILLPILDGNLRALFLLSFVASFFALITLIVFVKEPPLAHRAPVSLPKLSWRILPPRYQFFLIAIGVFAIANSSEAFLFLRASDVGVPTMLIPLLYALSNTVFALLATPFGRLADRMSPDIIIRSGFLVFALAYVGFALFATPLTMWLLFPLIGVFSAMTESLQKTINVQITDPRIKGTMLGLMHTITGIGQLPASIIAGLLWGHVGAESPFLFGAGLAIVAALILERCFSSAKKIPTAAA